MRSLCSFLLLLLAFGLTLQTAAAQDTAKLVIMLDLSGSTSTSGPVNDLAIAREAAKSLLRYFQTQPVERRPYVAIGTFTVAEFDAARILSGGALTNDYGTESPPTGLFEVLEGVQTTGGYTDLAAAISAAQTHLETSTIVGPGYIALISDGTPNRPGLPEYYDCDECGCAASYGATVAARLAASQSGTTLFAIHYEGHGYPGLCPLEPQKGIDFMRDELVVNPANFFPSNGDLNRVFAQISCAISCDDNDPCTSDSCDNQTGFCTHTPITSDADNDTVPDCRDRCFGNDALLNTTCQEVGTCQAAGEWRCGPQNSLICNSGGVLPPEQCYQCSSTGKTNEIALVAQRSQVLGSRALKIGKLVRRSFKTKKSVKTLVATSLSSLNTLRAEADALIQSIPDPFVSCLNTQACQSITLLPTTLGVVARLDSKLELAKKMYRKGRRVGSAKVRSTLKKFFKQSQQAHSEALTALRTLPSVHSVCD